MNRTEVIERLSRTKLLALDVDGVLTDDSIFFGPDGMELKRFNISDGLFMVLAMRSGLELAIVSGRKSPATESRMKDLGVKHVLQGYTEKTKQLEPLLKKLGLEFSEVAFIGNEILDIKLCSKAGFGIAVADSCPELLEAADFVTQHKGGLGAVREIIELYFEANGIDPKEILS